MADEFDPPDAESVQSREEAGCNEQRPRPTLDEAMAKVRAEYGAALDLLGRL